MEIPKELTAGDLWTWTEILSDHPAPTWALTYYFRGAKALSAPATPNGANHVISVAADATKAFPPGNYEWQARVVNGLTVVTIGTGRVAINPNLADIQSDARTFNQRVLEALQAVIENRASTDQLTLSINGRSISRMTWDEIHAAYDRYRLAVAAELGLRPHRVLTRFGQT
jgi:metal-dependent amidase/aminoacylase/carboxypeptidase family protein